MGRLGLLLFTAVLAQGGPEAELRVFERTRFEAMIRADTAALRRFLAPELVYTHSNGLVESRELHLEAIGARRTVYDSLAQVSMTYHAYGDLVTGTGEVKSKGSLNGTAFDVRLRVSTVHHRRDGRWQLLLWQSTRIP